MVVAIALAAALSASALAAWSVQGNGSAGAAATTMPAGKTPTVRVSGGDVFVTWSAATFPNGTPVAGYDIRRYNAVTGASATVGANCNGAVTATTCTEHNVAVGTWTYTDTPIQQSWTGGESPQSSPAQVIGGAAHAKATPGPPHQPHDLTMPRGAVPTARVYGSDVVVTWPAATLADGARVAGYIIRRYDAATGRLASVGSSCDSVAATTTCTEHDVPAGMWTYTDTPTEHGRTGPESRGSDPIEIQAPAPPSTPHTSPAPSPPTPAQSPPAPHEPAMPAGNTPTARVSGRDVVVTWSAATFANGAPVAGYLIRRYKAANGISVVVTVTCQETVTGTTCTERDVPAGTWTYTDTPIDKGRTGMDSPRSNPVQITTGTPAPRPRPQPPHPTH